MPRPLHAPPPRRLVLAGAGAALLTLTGCTRMALMLARDPVIPMATLAVPAGCGAAGPERSNTLLVLLPGAYSTPQEFIANGTPEALRQAGRRADLLIADAHLGYMGSGSLAARLEQDVLAPARARGYAQIWLVGISLGGWAALACAARGEVRVDGVFAVAPYLGRRTLLRDIVAAGGPRAWAASTPADPTDADARIWRWLAQPPAAAAPVWLGWGTEDRFADTNGLASTLLPPERVSTVPGGHDWPPWRVLIARWFSQAPWPDGCAQGVA